MVISPGTRLGPYEVLAPLGAGALGDVYRARGARQGRAVWMTAGLLSAALASVAGGAAAGEAATVERRLAASREVIQQVAGAIPRELLDRAECVLVFPAAGKEAGPAIGGAGICRGEGGYGPWGPPVLFLLSGGPADATTAAHVLLVLQGRSIEHFMAPRLVLGQEVTMAPGPFGRGWEDVRDGRIQADLLAYARRGGGVEGASLDGAIVSSDDAGMRALYGPGVSAREVLVKARRPLPAAARPLVDALHMLSPRNAGAW